MIYQLNKIEVFKGRPAQIPLVLIDNAGHPLPTASLQHLKLYLRQQDDTLLEKEADAGITWGYGETFSLYVFNLTAEQTSLLKGGYEQNAFVKLTFPTTEMRFKYRGFISVLEEVF